MKQKIVLIGAGSANFGLRTMGDLFNNKAFEGSTICLHDINPVALKRTEEFGRRHIQTRSLPYTLEATIDRKQALQGATFCIISIEVGNRFELWDQDWRVPQQYGIRQVYGENGGPGGLFHSLRISFFGPGEPIQWDRGLVGAALDALQPCDGQPLACLVVPIPSDRLALEPSAGGKARTTPAA